MIHSNTSLLTVACMKIKQLNDMATKQEASLMFISCLPEKYCISIWLQAVSKYSIELWTWR